MKRYHNYSIEDLDNLYPFEMEIYATKLKELLRQGEK